MTTRDEAAMQRVVRLVFESATPQEMDEATLPDMMLKSAMDELLSTLGVDMLSLVDEHGHLDAPAIQDCKGFLDQVVGTMVPSRVVISYATVLYFALQLQYMANREEDMVELQEGHTRSAPMQSLILAVCRAAMEQKEVCNDNGEFRNFLKDLHRTRLDKGMGDPRSGYDRVASLHCVTTQTIMGQAMVVVRLDVACNIVNRVFSRFYKPANLYKEIDGSEFKSSCSVGNASFYHVAISPWPPAAVVLNALSGLEEQRRVHTYAEMMELCHANQLVNAKCVLLRQQFYEQVIKEDHRNRSFARDPVTVMIEMKCMQGEVLNFMDMACNDLLSSPSSLFYVQGNTHLSNFCGWHNYVPLPSILEQWEQPLCANSAELLVQLDQRVLAIFNRICPALQYPEPLSGAHIKDIVRYYQKEVFNVWKMVEYLRMHRDTQLMFNFSNQEIMRRICPFRFMRDDEIHFFKYVFRHKIRPLMRELGLEEQMPQVRETANGDYWEDAASVPGTPQRDEGSSQHYSSPARSEDSLEIPPTPLADSTNASAPPSQRKKKMKRRRNVISDDEDDDALRAPPQAAHDRRDAENKVRGGGTTMWSPSSTNPHPPMLWQEPGPAGGQQAAGRETRALGGTPAKRARRFISEAAEESGEEGNG